MAFQCFVRLRCLSVFATVALTAVLGCSSGSTSATSTAPPAPTASISISPATVAEGQSATLSWASTNATACMGSGSWTGSQTTSGTLTVTPKSLATLTYSLTCVNSSGVSSSTQSASLTVSPPPAPVVTISFSPGSVIPGASSTLTWSATNATSCTASGSWSGSQLVSGSQTVTQYSIAGYTYSLSCTGDGGTGSGSASLLDTKLKPSSYENKNNVGAVPVTLPTLNGYNAFATADFMNDGGQTVVFHSLEYTIGNPATYQMFGHIRFFENVSGTWVERTLQLLSNNVGCLHPRKAIVADFNRDGKPDVFFACTGEDSAPFPGEQPHMLLSQPNGTYTNVTLPVTCYCHSASAADINGDGYPDLLVTDTSVVQKPYFLINNGNGTFTQDFTRLPTSVNGKQIYTAELIDFSAAGHYDVFLGGNEPGTTSYAASEFAPEILPNDGHGSFISTTPVNLLVGGSYGLALDIVFQNGSIYLLKVNPAYTANEIQKIAYPSLSPTSIIYSHSGVYATGSNWVDWILPYNGNIVSEDAAFNISVPQ